MPAGKVWKGHYEHELVPSEADRGALLMDLNHSKYSAPTAKVRVAVPTTTVMRHAVLTNSDAMVLVVAVPATAVRAG